MEYNGIVVLIKVIGIWTFHLVYFQKEEHYIMFCFIGEPKLENAYTIINLHKLPIVEAVIRFDDYCKLVSSGYFDHDAHFEWEQGQRRRQRR